MADFAAQARRLVDDAELRRRLGEEGRAYVTQRTARGLAEALLAFYRNLQSGGSGI